MPKNSNGVNTHQMLVTVREDEYQMLLTRAKHTARRGETKLSVAGEVRGILRGQTKPLPYDAYWDRDDDAFRE